MNDSSTEDLARALFEEAGDALFLFDPNTDQLISANIMAQRLTGFSRDELMTYKATDLFRYGSPDAATPGGEQRLRRAASHTGIFHSQEGYVLRTRTEGVWISVNISIARLHVRPRTLALMTARDIREQRAAMERLRKVEAELRRVLASISDCIWSGECDGQSRWAFRYFSPVIEKLTGHPASYFLEKFLRWRDLIHPEDQPRLERAMARVRKGEATQEEYRLLLTNGSVRWVRDSIQVSRAANATALRLDGVLTDLTESKAIQEALLEERRQAADSLGRERNLLRTLIDNLPDYIYIKDPQSCFVTANRATLLTLGVGQEEDVRGKTDFDFLPRERAEQYFGDERQVVGTGEALINREELVIDAAGTSKWCLTTKLPLRDGKGQITGLVGISHDITERKHADEERARLLALEQQARAEAEAAALALRASEEQYRSLAEAIPQLVWTAGPDGRATYHNSGWLEYTGVIAEQLLARGWDDVLHPDDRERCRNDWTQAVGTGQAYEAAYRFRRADGVFRWHLGRALPVVDRAGQVVRWFGTFTDIDDQRKAAEAMKDARDAAQAANRAKSEFLANVSHEIRTPMSGIIGMTELTLDTDLTRRQREFLTLVKSSADSLLTILNDILDFSKIEAGKLELDPHDFHLRDSLGDALKALAARAHSRDLELAFHIAPDVPDALVGDPIRVRQVVVNLVGNAIKFTKQGEVVVRVEKEESLAKSQRRKEEDKEGEGQNPDDPTHLFSSSSLGDLATLREILLHFSVRDTGIGIPPDRQERIFQAFEQADGSTTREYGGTGLGLAISSRLVSMMHGRIWVESEPGKGSTFHFTARFGLGTGTVSQSAPLSRLAGLPVLVVDDNATNRLILEEMLLGWGMQPALAEGAAAALERLEQAGAAGEPFPLVLADVHMPQDDGFTLVEWIRERPALAGAAIVMLTSGGQPGDVDRCQKLGITAHLTKPVKQSDLFNGIVLALGAAPTGETAREPSAAPTARSSGVRPLRVLLAEDNLVNRTYVLRRLEQRGDSVVAAGNGREAIEAWENGEFDVVLMDVQMPEMGGFEATAVIRRREQETGRGRTPIIAMTAHAMKGDRERCLEANMDGYISKPIDPAIFSHTLDSIANAAQPVPAPAQPNSPALVASGVAEAPRNPPAEECVLDREDIRKRVGDDPRLLQMMVQAFFSECPRLMSDVHEALAAGDTQRVRRATHTLMAAVGTFGAREAYAAALQLGTLAREGNLTAAREGGPKLQECIDRLGPALVALAEQGGCVSDPHTR